MARLLLKAALILSSAFAVAPPTIAQSAPARATPAAVDPEAMRAVDRMAVFLRTLTTFEIKANSTIESVLPDGQKLQFTGTTEYQIKRPNGFYADLRTDRVDRQFYFDGSNLTMFAPRMQYYSSIDVPGTIRDMLNVAYARYGILIPLADLFCWGESPACSHAPSSAMVVGYARIGDVATDHYAFSENGMDYQIWIQRGEQPLPIKMVLTDAGDPERPQYTATLRWNLKPAIAADRFTFKPPANVTRITAVEVGD